MVDLNLDVCKSHLEKLLPCRFLTPCHEIKIQDLGPQILGLGLVCSCFLITISANYLIKLSYNYLHSRSSLSPEFSTMLNKYW